MRQIGKAGMGFAVALGLGCWTGVATAQESKPTNYHEISSFFNVREANSNVEEGEWELEAIFKWVDSTGDSDKINLAQSIKYGFTNTFHLELEVEEPDFGDGGNHGAGEVSITAFYRLLEETNEVPALGAFLQGRFPSGDASSGVDGTLSAIMTKTVAENFRFHVQGFVQTANGDIGDDTSDRRPFQWGAGPGVDYQLDDDTILALNYLFRVNSEEGQPNQNVVELGMVRELGDWDKTEHAIKLAVDFGVDGLDSTPDYGAKLLWDITWK